MEDVTQEHDVDAIIAQAYGTGQPEAVMPDQAPAVQEPPQPKEWEFDWKGQKVKADEQKLIKWAQQGYDYAQNINAFKSEREKWDRERQDWEKRYNPYREIDDFASQNPDWWSHVEQSYQQRLAPQGEIPEGVKQYLEPIVKDYNLVKSFVQEFQKEKEEKAFAEQDAKLEQEIQSIRSQYPDLDFSALDESGYSLEQRVLDHAMKNGMPNFRSAFLDYYHDQLIKYAEARGKESVTKDMKARKKLGLLDEKPAPSDLFSKPASTRNKSWSDIHQEVLQELNLA